MRWLIQLPKKSKLSKPPKWNKLFRVRELGLTKGMGVVLVLVPILGGIKMLVAEHTGLSLSLPFNFLLLYFSAFLSLLAGIVFDMFCPSIIKLNKNYPNFFKQSQVLGIEILSKQAELSERKDKALDDLVQGIFDKQQPEGKAPQRSPSLTRYTTELTKMNMLWRTGETWDSENSSATFARWVTFILYLLSGAVGLYIVLIDAPLRVVSAL